MAFSIFSSRVVSRDKEGRGWSLSERVQAAT